MHRSSKGKLAWAKVGGFVLLIAVSLPILPPLWNAVQLRIGMGYFSIITLVGNPFTAILYSDPVPLIDQLKNLL